MCMGGGGGGGGAVSEATINQPSQGEYDEIAKVVEGISDEVAGLFSKKKGSLLHAYDLLNSSNAGLQKVMLKTELLQMKAANNQLLLAQDAARLAALKGPPPPEKGADAPLIGAQRHAPRSTKETGRTSLRIDRTTPPPSLTV